MDSGLNSDTAARLVVLTNGNYFARVILGPLLQKYRDSIASVFIISGDYRGRTGLRSLWWVGRSTAFPYLLYKIVTIALVRVFAILRRGEAFDVARLAQREGIPVQHFTSVRSAAAIEAIERAAPDLIVSVSCPQLIPGRVLAAGRLGGINIHSSLLPRFAGLAPYYWVLAEGERATGTTVHFMTSTFDEGNVLSQEEVEIAPRDSAFALFLRLSEVGGRVLLNSVIAALDGYRGVPMDREGASYRSHPNMRSYVRLRLRGHRLIRLRDIRMALHSAATVSDVLALAERH